MLAEFIDKIDLADIRVFPPTRRILICGGETSAVKDPEYENVMKSLRDSCLRSRFRSGNPGFPNFDFILIEELQEYFDKECPYSNLLDFEKDMAQVCELVLLIAEGAGSFVELGSFSVIQEIREKLLLVIRRKFLSARSYIALGPVAALKAAHPNSVASLTDALVGVSGEDFSKVDPMKMGRFLKDPLIRRLSESASRTTLNNKDFNHSCKFYTAILREFYSLKDEEILLLMECFGFDFSNIDFEKVIFCCRVLEWTSTTHVEFDRVHFAYPRNEAAQFKFFGGWSDKMRRRQIMRAHWEDVDPHRVAAVDEELMR